MSKRLLVAVLGLATGVVASGCSSSQDSYRTISGQVDAQAYALDNAAIVAHASDGKTYLAAIARDGRFSLTLPVGVRQSLAIANHTKQGTLREISLLTWHGISARTRTIMLRAGAAIDLGAIHPVGATAHVRNATTDATGEGSATATSHDANDDHDDAIDDHKDCEDHDHTTLCVDDSHDDSECDDDHHQGLDCDDGGKSGKDAPTSSGSSDGPLAKASYGEDGEDHHGDHGEDHSSMCSTPGGSAEGGSTTTGQPGGPTTTGSGGKTACLVNADCGANSICVNSQCEPVVL